MLNFNNTKTGKKLGIGFGVCIIAMLIICFMFIINFITNKTKLNYINNVTLNCVEAANNVSSRINELMRIFGIMPFLSDDAYKQEKEKIPNLRQEYDKALKTIESLEDSAAGKKMLEEIKEMIKPAAAKNNKMMRLIEEGKKLEAQMLYLNETKKNVDEILIKIDKYIHFQKEKTNVEIANLYKTNIYLFTITLIVSFAAILLSILFAIIISKKY